MVRLRSVSTPSPMVRSSSQRRPLAQAVLAFAVCAGVGCEQPTDYSILDLSEVTGVVTLDGRPLPGAVVRFVNEDGISFSEGTTDPQGRYRLWLNSEQPGVSEGLKTVRITRGGEEEEESEEPEEGTGPTASKPLPARYNTQSELQRTINQPSHVFDFELKSSE